MLRLQLPPTLLMRLAAVGWQCKNGLLVTRHPSQPVAGLRLYHCELLPAVAQLCCMIVEMHLAVASWQFNKCSLPCFCPKFQNLIKMRCGGSAVLEWAVSFQTPFHTVPYPFQTRTTHVPP